MIQHDVLPAPETWTSGEAQRYGWQHHSNSEGVYGAYGHMLVARRNLPLPSTVSRVEAMRAIIEVIGEVPSSAGNVTAADIVIANAMKPDGQISTDQEAFEVDLQVGVYILRPSVEVCLPQV